MNTYRISKYSLQNKNKGAQTKEEWTDYSDIGKTFDGRILNEKEYKQVENNYISCIVDILRQASVSSLVVKELENYDHLHWKNNQCISLEFLPMIFRDCLRNKCWCKFETKDAYVHFGYDYYVYIGTVLPFAIIEKSCYEHKLFCNEQNSPYNNQAE